MTNILSSFFSADKFIGIQIGVHNITMTIGIADKKTEKVFWSNSIELNESLEADSAYLSEQLASLFSSIPDVHKKGYLPVQVALPDSLFRFQEINFSKFPRRNDEQKALVKWQLNKLLHTNLDSYYINWQTLQKNEKNEKNTRILAYVINNAVVDTVIDAIETAEMSLGIINAASYYLYDLIESEYKDIPGGLLILNKDSWGLMFWNNEHYFNHIDSASRNQPEETLEEILIEVERVIWSYANKYQSLNNIFIIANESECNLAIKTLSENNSLTCKALTKKEKLSRAHIGTSLLLSDMSTIIPQ